MLAAAGCSLAERAGPFRTDETAGRLLLCQEVDGVLVGG